MPWESSIFRWQIRAFPIGCATSAPRNAAAKYQKNAWEAIANLVLRHLYGRSLLFGKISDERELEHLALQRFHDEHDPDHKKRQDRCRNTKLAIASHAFFW